MCEADVSDVGRKPEIETAVKARKRVLVTVSFRIKRYVELFFAVAKAIRLVPLSEVQLEGGCDTGKEGVIERSVSFDPPR